MTYARRVSVDRATAVPMVVAAFVGSGLGALLATACRAAAAAGGAGRPGGRAGLHLAPPGLGEVEALRLRPRHQRLVTLLGGFGIGVYDGLVGPGTGSFLVFLLVGVVGLSFLHASATAKAVNTATNLAALLLFAVAGHVLWGLGAAMAVCNLLGAQVGARLAVRRGSAWVRRVFLVVVTALVLRLAYDVLPL